MELIEAFSAEGMQIQLSGPSAAPTRTDRIVSPSSSEASFATLPAIHGWLQKRFDGKGITIHC
jgi:hypothetical protein